MVFIDFYYRYINEYEHRPQNEIVLIWYKSVPFHHFDKVEQLLYISYCFFSSIGPTLKGKNLLLEEQILFFSRVAPH